MIGFFAGTLTTPILTLLGWHLKDQWAIEGLQWLGAAYPLLIHPIVDHWLGTRIGGVSRGSDSGIGHDLVLWISFPVLLLVLITGLLRMDEVAFWSSAVCTGFCTGVYGVTAAHELIHRPGKAQWLGLGNLLLCGFAHFRIAHLRIHHRWAATSQDPSTARRGESLYAFWLRSAVGGWWHCLDARRHGDPHVLRDQGLQLATWAAVGAGFGAAGLGLFAVQSVIAILLLTTVDYLEHYGLQRSFDEPYGPQHAWEARQLLTNLTLFNLGLHPAHHLAARIHYPKLTSTPGAPQLPFGYSAALLTALLPPLWRRVMDPRIPEAKADKAA